MRDRQVQLEIERIRLKPGQEWGQEADKWRFVSLEAGTAYWLNIARPRELAPGELLVLSPGPHGAVRASQLTEAVLHWFSFHSESLLGLLTVTERDWIEKSAAAAMDRANCLPSTHPLAREVAALHQRSGSGCRLVERAESLVLALRILTQSMPHSCANSHHRGAASERFDEIVATMPDVELIQHSSEELAQLCGCTPRHFNRLFRIRFGIPTRVRQTELRLLLARQLLESSLDPIAQIAVHCGYRGISLFNSLFRRRFGMSPTQWRERSQKT